MNYNMESVKTAAICREDGKNASVFIAVKATRCPECGSSLIPDGGCFFCRSCGYSLCAL